MVAGVGLDSVGGWGWWRPDSDVEMVWGFSLPRPSATGVALRRCRLVARRVLGHGKEGVAAG